MRLSEAVDRYLDSVEDRCAPSTVKKYRDFLDEFANRLGPYFELEDVSTDHCEEFYRRYRNHAQKTKAGVHTALNQLFKYCVKRDKIAANPMDKIEYPKVPAPEDRGVKSISFKDVQSVMAECHTWTEKLCLGVLVYMGVRRAAANNLRWKDVDLKEGYIRFREKGGKYIRKPIPKPLFELLVAYRSLSEGSPVTVVVGANSPGSRPLSESDYVIPSDRPTTSPIRNDRFIWRVVKRVCERAGVDAHCHAFRAAFAVHYLESYDGDTIGLQNLMGHSQIATTQGYWRRLNKERSMEKVRELDWGVSLTPAGERPMRSNQNRFHVSAPAAASEGVSLTETDGSEVGGVRLSARLDAGGAGGNPVTSRSATELPVSVSEDDPGGENGEGSNSRGSAQVGFGGRQELRVLDSTARARVGELSDGFIEQDRRNVEDDAGSHKDAVDSRSDSMTVSRLRGKDSNLDSVKKQKASRSPRVKSSGGREKSPRMTPET